jgi:hypothetical protein
VRRLLLLIMYTGVVPIICQYTPGPGSLDDFYKIQFVLDPSLFADTTGAQAESHVIASNQRDTVKLDFALQIYVLVH